MKQSSSGAATVSPDSFSPSFPVADGPPLHPMEEMRLDELHSYKIQDSHPNGLLDSLTELAATLCEAPMAYISLVGRDRQWIIARYGTELKESCRSDSFCGFTILDSEQPFIVPDTSKDPRFIANPLVTGDPHIRFYAGFPLCSPDALPIGSLCVIDTRPRKITANQIRILSELAHVVMNLLSTHRTNTRLKAFSELTNGVLNRLFSFSLEMKSRPSSSTEDLLISLIDHLDPHLDWSSARISNPSRGSFKIIQNPAKVPDNKIAALWEEIAILPRKDEQGLSLYSRFNPSVPDPYYAHLVIPINSRGKLTSVLELIFPNHLETDLWGKELLDLMVSNISVVAERELLNVELLHQATRDALTGAANRTLFLGQLRDAIANTDSSCPDCALFYIDLDDFKDVNDNFGHDTGDSLLSTIALRLRNCCRESDLVGRLSGDEFVLLARNINSTEGLEQLLKRLKACFEEPLEIKGNQLMISASIGCVMITKPSISVERLMQQAEGVMYLVKNGHRKGICVADEEILRNIGKRRNLILEVKEALRKNKLSLVMQSIVDLERGGIVGAEFLLRITGKNGEILPAEQFMDTIERTHYLLAIDEWVFNEALRIIKGMPDELSVNGEFFFSINVTPAILSTQGYGAQCLEKIRNQGISPSSIMMEITENNLIPLGTRVVENLQDLRKGGVRIAVDDFGTGYSNLRQLATLPLDVIKIDKSLVISSSGDGKGEALLGAAVAIASNLELSVIAEGIERVVEEDLIRSLGCRFAQGYLYGRPAPVEDFLVLLQKQFFLSSLRKPFQEIMTVSRNDHPELHQAMFLYS